MRKLSTLAFALIAAGALAQTTFNESEPNDTKATANAFSLAPGDLLAGSSTGSSGSGAASADYFRLSFGAATPGVYLHQLAIAPATSGAFVGSVLGYAQVNGVIDPSAQMTAQISVIAETTNDRINRFYSFGGAFTANYRITGTSSTTNPYSVKYTRQAVSVTNLGTLNDANVSIATTGTADSDIALYDANGVLVGQNDDTGVTLNSLLNRTLVAGRYTLAIALSNLANDQPSDANDAFRDGNVLDGPNFLLGSSSSQNNSIPFTITDGAAGSFAATATIASKQQVAFYSFNVAPVPEPASVAALSLGALALIRRRRAS